MHDEAQGQRDVRVQNSKGFEIRVVAGAGGQAVVTKMKRIDYMGRGLCVCGAALGVSQIPD